MSNVLRNLLGIFIIAMFVLSAIVVLSITGLISSKIYNISNSTYTTLGIGPIVSPQTAAFKAQADDATNTIITGINFLIVLIVVLTLYSSFVSQTNISSYLLTFIASSIMSGVLVYLFHQIYNSFVIASAGTIIDFTSLSDFLFINFDNIILLNMIAFLLSFIFKKKSP